MKREDFSSPDFDIGFTDNVYREIWNEGEYNRHGVTVDNGDIVLDLGAHVGLFSQYAIHRGASSVYCFESHDEIFQHLLNNTRNTNGITCYKQRISSNEFNLQNIFELTNLERANFCKVDIEGYEYDLLLNTPDEVIQKVDKWAVEFHIWGWWDNQATEFKSAFSIMEKFTKNGYHIGCDHIHKNTNLIMMYAKKSV